MHYNNMTQSDQATYYTRRHMLLKLAEESTELAAELLKHVNKQDKDNMKRVVGEMYDVEKWLFRVKREFDIK